MTEATVNESKQLAKVERLTPAVFESKKISKLVKDVTREVLSLVPDASTEKGRKEVKSLAYKVSRTKTTLDNMGKEHVAEIKAKAKVIDECRKTWRDAMDELKETVLQPVTEYEEREEKRVGEITARIDRIRSLAQADDGEGHFYTSEELRSRRDELHAIDVDDSFAEFSEKAAAQWGYAAKTIETLIAGAEAQEAADAEEEKRRKKQEEEDRAAEQKAIAKKAAAEERAKIEREQQQKKEAQEREEKARKEEEEKRARNKQHRGKVNREALKALRSVTGLGEEEAKGVIEAIARGQIPNVSISY